ncbi:hypothetical protein IEU95_05955 [Hoyosella rhizosphaerae]|uniref:Uncharacterized protein n=1 Tax=Hoyosella rhizosphaerae TaxID=1755582 RepID=A0A916U452_9ACTN|nr:hypothetical protein [Hoyosella rhizosphaerae]MBN4926366.1 hypothetical protein [Hoyosella rhizosphaerae]GGC59945.1 hypothetical protein GCM10011410_10500 [Hoyosella rhizosphaerae]
MSGNGSGKNYLRRSALGVATCSALAALAIGTSAGIAASNTISVSPINDVTAADVTADGVTAINLVHIDQSSSTDDSLSPDMADLWALMVPRSEFPNSHVVRDYRNGAAAAAIMRAQGVPPTSLDSTGSCVMGAMPDDVKPDGVVVRTAQTTDGVSDVSIAVMRTSESLADVEAAIQDCRFATVVTANGGVVELDTVLLPQPHVPAGDSLAFERAINAPNVSGPHHVLALVAQIGDIRIVALSANRFDDRPDGTLANMLFYNTLDRLTEAYADTVEFPLQ